MWTHCSYSISSRLLKGQTLGDMQEKLWDEKARKPVVTVMQWSGCEEDQGSQEEGSSYVMKVEVNLGTNTGREVEGPGSWAWFGSNWLWLGAKSKLSESQFHLPYVKMDGYLRFFPITMFLNFGAKLYVQRKGRTGDSGWRWDNMRNR